MTWETVAKKDFREAMDSTPVSWVLALLLLAFVLGGYVLPFEFLGSGAAPGLSTSDYPGYMLGATGLLVPLLGILLGYDSIVSERSSGQLALLLSLPHSRRDVVLGKLAGRSLVLALGVGLGTLLGGALVVYPFGALEPLAFLGYVLLTFLFGVAFVGIALAISAWTTSRQVAMATGFGVFVLSAVVWPQLRGVVAVALTRLGLADGGLPGWAAFVHGAEPGMLYARIVRASFDGTGPATGPDAPWYMGEWVAVGLLSLWVVGPIALGYRRFANTDL